jgi:hypothetical protein
MHLTISVLTTQEFSISNFTIFIQFSSHNFQTPATVTQFMTLKNGH